MRSHRFDPLSAAFGIIAVALGLLVATDSTGDIDTGWWLALATLAIGLALVPWTGRRSTPEHDDPEPSSAD